MQHEILDTFGNAEPSAPVLRCRNATQTAVVLEWDPIQLATAELRSLSLYRNGVKAGVIPRDKQSTKISGLAIDTEYEFHLVLRTSAGQYTSERIKVTTHKMTDLTGITITPGVMPAPLKDSLAETVHRIGAKMIDTVRIDTTHLVCTEPRGQAWEKAVEMNVPVVVPDWLKGCEREGRVVGVRQYYLDADPKLRQLGASTIQQQRSGSTSQPSTGSGPRIEHTPPTPDRPTQERRDTDSSTTSANPPQWNTARDERVGAPADDEDTQSESTEKATERSSEEAAEPSTDNETIDQQGHDTAEEDGKFDEVSL